MSAIDLILQYPFMQRALLGAIVVAVLCGALGVYVVLRGLSMLGDGLAHVSFAGVALGLALGVYPLPLALAAAVGGAVLVHALRSRDILRADAAIGVLFTAGLSAGLVLVSATGGVGVSAEAYLFGNLLSVTTRDLAVVGGLGAAFLALLALLRKELLYTTLSEEAARLGGVPVDAISIAFMALTAASIVLAARIVGVLLVSALLVVPAASALQIARSFRSALAWSVTIALAAALAGTWAAAEFGLATGASIALASTILFAAVVATRAATA